MKIQSTFQSHVKIVLGLSASFDYLIAVLHSLEIDWISLIVDILLSFNKDVARTGKVSNTAS